MGICIIISSSLFGSNILTDGFTQNMIAPNSYNIDSNDSLGFVGKTIPSEKKTWFDKTTGFEITQWTTTGVNNHPYFTTESFVDEETVLIFSWRTGKKQLYRLNLLNGELTQMTDANKMRDIEHLPKYNSVWYLDGKILCSLNTKTLESREVYDFSAFQYSVGSFTVTCDARNFVFSSNHGPIYPDVEVIPENFCGYGPFAIHKLNLENKTIDQITIGTGFNIGHLQANPSDPKLILYCWQWEALGRSKLVGETPIRIWWVNIDGTDGGPFAQEFGLHATHECWTRDGSKVTYTGDFRFGTQKGREIIGIASIDGKEDKLFDATVWHAHQNMAADNKHLVADLFNHDDRLLVLFRINEKEIEETKILFKHDSSWDGQGSHPHPRFSPNGTYILFSTDRTKIPQVYTVKVNLNTNK